MKRSSYWLVRHFLSLSVEFCHFMGPILTLSLAMSPVAQAVTAEGIYDRFFSPFGEVELTSSDMKRTLWHLASNPQASLLKPEQITPEELHGCLNQYSEFYQDGVLDINFVIGYHDWAQVRRTLDQDAFNMIYESLTRSCSDDLNNVCGFQEVDRVYSSQAVLEKRFAPLEAQAEALGLSLDHPLLQEGLRIRVRLTHSSWSRYDRDNFVNGKIRTEQEETSMIAENTFFAGVGEPGHSLSTSDVVSYLGHARDGGGPDFRAVPLEWREENGEPDYKFYLKNRSNFRRLLRALGTSNHPTKQLISVMGCNSKVKFYNSRSAACPVQGQKGCRPVTLKNFEKKYGFLLTSKLSWPNNQARYVAMFFDGLVNFKCKSAINHNFSTLDKIPKVPEAYRIIGNAF